MYVAQPQTIDAIEAVRANAEKKKIYFNNKYNN